MSKQPVIAIALCASFFVSFAAFAQANTLDAQAIVRKSDQARGGDLDSGMAMQSTIVSLKDGKEVRSYSVLIESHDGNSLITFTAPAFSRGTKMLMRQRNMWFLSSDVKKPVPISPRQRLLGDASNGDIATVNLARDYTAKITGEATVDNLVCHKIELIARTKDTSYDRIVYYVTKADQLGIKAEYYTVSGRLFKTASMRYENKLTVAGRAIPFLSRMEIGDAVDKKQKTVLTYANPQLRSIPPSRFDLQSLMTN